MPETGNNKRYTQARGRARREALIVSARALLHERELDEITLPMVSERAEIPPSSTYHFFPDIRSLYKDLARSVVDEMAHITPQVTKYRRWQDCVATYLEASADYFNSDAAARQLLLGPKTAPDIKSAACHDDMRFGRLLFSMLDSNYHLPKMKDPVLPCFYAIQIADTFFSLSVIEHGKITDRMLDEAIVGATSYLGNYLPPILELREIEAPKRASRGRKSRDGAGRRAGPPAAALS